MSKKRDEKLSNPQKKVLVQFMLENVTFAQGKLMDVEGKMKHNKLWQDLTDLLNQTEGPVKETIKWQRVWTDIKQKLKVKATQIRSSRNRRGGPGTTAKLTDVEERILNILSKDSDEDPLGNIGLFEEVKVKSELDEVPTLLSRVETDVDVFRETSVPSHSRQSSSPVAGSRSRRSSMEQIIENFTEQSVILNVNVGEISKTLKALLEEKKKTNNLLQDLINVLKK